MGKQAHIPNIVKEKTTVPTKVNKISYVDECFSLPFIMNNKLTFVTPALSSRSYDSMSICRSFAKLQGWLGPPRHTASQSSPGVYFRPKITSRLQFLLQQVCHTQSHAVHGIIQ